MSTRTVDMLWLGADPGDQPISADIAGSKAAEIGRMARLGLRTPPAFALPTTLCSRVNADPPHAADLVLPALRAGIARLEAATGRRFGDPREPLLVSVRSGAAKSMPGMLSTVLNVGLNPETVHGLIRLTGDPRFAWDSYRRFIDAYATVVLEAPSAAFAAPLNALIDAEAVADESELDGEALERLTLEFADIAERHSGCPIPHDPMDQLARAAVAVYRSWEGHKAREYRRLNALEGLTGTAVTVQAMVYGNAGRRSGAGVAFSRDPSTGENALYVDFLFNAQGEDVVSGRRTPLDSVRFGARLPKLLDELARGAALLEADRKDVQDLEFTVQDGELFFLQTRSAKRTPRAALRIIVDLVHEGILDEATALARLEAVDLRRAASTRFVEPMQPVARGVPAASGVACGRVAFDSAAVKALVAGGDPAILVRREPATDDIEGMAAADGVLTAVGGRTSHAAVVARQLGKVCVVGCRALQIEEAGDRAALAGNPLHAGDWLCLDGFVGDVGLGRRTVAADAPAAALAEVARWKARLQGSLATPGRVPAEASAEP